MFAMILDSEFIGIIATLREKVFTNCTFWGPPGCHCMYVVPFKGHFLYLFFYHKKVRNKRYVFKVTY